MNGLSRASLALCMPLSDKGRDRIFYIYGQMVMSMCTIFIQV